MSTPEVQPHYRPDVAWLYDHRGPGRWIKADFVHRRLLTDTHWTVDHWEEATAVILADGGRKEHQAAIALAVKERRRRTRTAPPRRTRTGPWIPFQGPELDVDEPVANPYAGIGEIDLDSITPYESLPIPARPTAAPAGAVSTPSGRDGLAALFADTAPDDDLDEAPDHPAFDLGLPGSTEPVEGRDVKATTALQRQQEERALQRAQLAPMRPEWIYRRQGWNSFTREDIAQPDLADHPPLPTEDERLSDPRLAYHAHLKLVSHQGYDEVLLASFRAVMVNSERREGILDRVIDGMSGTGKSLLLRAIGRTVQRDIEDRTKGALGVQTPVVHILAPADTDSKVNWVWEIACFLGLSPEPFNENDLLRWRSYPNLTAPVNYVLENALTRLLLVDDIQRVQPHQLAPVLHYFDYLRNQLGITTIFCGTSAAAATSVPVSRTRRPRSRHTPCCPSPGSTRSRSTPRTKKHGCKCWPGTRNTSAYTT
ncbi:ATP-binding protein [Streptomyces sp. NPDC018711]|uniref:ATP-binding protein n=1 Tax=Streptomyces sp. NPDC018711 TaxID=3365052 RepID=UPI003789CAC9